MAREMGVFWLFLAWRGLRDGEILCRGLTRGGGHVWNTCHEFNHCTCFQPQEPLSRTPRQDGSPDQGWVGERHAAL